MRISGFHSGRPVHDAGRQSPGSDRGYPGSMRGSLRGIYGRQSSSGIGRSLRSSAFPVCISFASAPNSSIQPSPQLHKISNWNYLQVRHTKMSLLKLASKRNMQLGWLSDRSLFVVPLVPVSALCETGCMCHSFVCLQVTPRKNKVFPIHAI